MMAWPRVEALRRCLGCFLGDIIPERLFAQDDKLLGMRSPEQPKSNSHGSGTQTQGAIGPRVAKGLRVVRLSVDVGLAGEGEILGKMARYLVHLASWHH